MLEKVLHDANKYIEKSLVCVINAGCVLKQYIALS